MEQNPTNTTALFVAFELSKKTWVMAIKSPLSDKISQYRVEGGDTTAVVALIQRVRAKAQDAFGAPIEVVSCYEAGRDGFWLHRFLTDQAVCNYVIDPAS